MGGRGDHLQVLAHLARAGGNRVGLGRSFLGGHSHHRGRLGQLARRGQEGPARLDEGLHQALHSLREEVEGSRDFPQLILGIQFQSFGEVPFPPGDILQPVEEMVEGNR